ncbi:MAG: hypothetical protein EPO08_20580 [Rhodospirillaceae bacterium]|nr:MAG: hypothetical protein EPO08_20580 [Rhodospirillaceae bacterium]
MNKPDEFEAAIMNAALTNTAPAAGTGEGADTVGTDTPPVDETSPTVMPAPTLANLIEQLQGSDTAAATAATTAYVEAATGEGDTLPDAVPVRRANESKSKFNKRLADYNAKLAAAKAASEAAATPAPEQPTTLNLAGGFSGVNAPDDNAAHKAAIEAANLNAALDTATSAMTALAATGGPVTDTEINAVKALIEAMPAPDKPSLRDVMLGKKSNLPSIAASKPAAPVNTDLVCRYDLSRWPVWLAAQKPDHDAVHAAVALTAGLLQSPTSNVLSIAIALWANRDDVAPVNVYDIAYGIYAVMLGGNKSVPDHKMVKIQAMVHEGLARTRDISVPTIRAGNGDTKAKVVKRLELSHAGLNKVAKAFAAMNRPVPRWLSDPEGIRAEAKVATVVTGKPNDPMAAMTGLTGK